MLDIICDKCKGLNRLDERLTKNEYVNSMETLVIENGELSNVKPNYFYYTCVECGNSRKYSVKDLLIRIRDKFVFEAMRLRQDMVNDFLKDQAKPEEKSGIVTVVNALVWMVKVIVLKTLIIFV